MADHVANAVSTCHTAGPSQVLLPPTVTFPPAPTAAFTVLNKMFRSGAASGMPPGYRLLLTFNTTLVGFARGADIEIINPPAADGTTNSTGGMVPKLPGGLMHENNTSAGTP